jgi:hypothetical protein
MTRRRRRPRSSAPFVPRFVKGPPQVLDCLDPQLHDLTVARGHSSYQAVLPYRLFGNLSFNSEKCETLRTPSLASCLTRLPLYNIASMLFFTSLLFFFFIVLTGMSYPTATHALPPLTTPQGLYFTRSTWLPLVPPSVGDSLSNFQLRPSQLPFSRYFYTPLPTSFADDMEAGFSSSDFDLSGNVASGDSRHGLDDEAKREIRTIMQGSWFKAPMSFDEARRVYMERRLERSGIGRDGMPRDPKLVTFS